jgi:hypothetical protein
MNSTTNDFGTAVTILHEVLQEFRRELDSFRTFATASEQANRELVTAVRALVKTLNTPTKRSSTVELPSGPVTMTTEEHR